MIHCRRPAGPPRASALNLPRQAAPVDRRESGGAAGAGAGVEADLFGFKVGDWLEAPGKVLWNHVAKPWLNG